MAFKWYPFDIVDFRKDTYHLNVAAEGIYRRLIDEYMFRRSALPDNDDSLAGIARITADDWEAHKTTIRAFFIARSGKLFHKRCETEINAQSMRAACRTAQGKMAAAARWHKHKQHQSNGMHEQCSSNARSMLNDATLTLSKKERRETEKELAPSPSLTKTLKEKGWA